MAVPNAWRRVMWYGVLALGLMVPGAVMVATAAAQQPGSLSAPASKPLYEIYECPHTWPDSIISIAPSTTNIPEFHDCQRFIMPSGTSYGSLVAVFAWDKLDMLAGRLTAVRRQAARAFAAAEILNVDVDYGRGDTTKFQVPRGYSCLYMFKDLSWHAKLATYGPEPPDCRKPVNLDTIKSQRLEVRVIAKTFTDFKNEDYPPAARWEWDSTHATYYVGIKCEPTSWCEIGIPDFASSTTYSAKGTWERPIRSSRVIKGWYDEQRLAVNVADARVRAATGKDTTLVPDSVVATVFPASGLKTRTMAHYKGNWRKVAYVSLSAPSPTYASEFNFVPPVSGTNEPDSTTVWICGGNKAECPGVPPDLRCRLHPGAEAGVLWAKVEAPRRAAKYLCVSYWKNPLGSPDPPGSVRWRFVSKDEWIWVTCPNGCCMVQRPGA